MSRFYNALVPAAGGGLPALPGSVSAADLPMLRLWQAVEARLAGRPRRVVQIVPCTEAEADQAVAVRLARLAGKGMAGGVLLLNAVTSETVMDDDGLVAFGPLPRGGDARALNAGLLNAYWDRLSQAAGLVVIDSPALLSSPLAQAMAPTVDGVVLVVEAERTRAAIAQAARDSLKAAGANILGVVLNKRRFHVPKAIYDRL
jgi:Mrp family chromosome partitioning ATPase